MHKGRVTGSSRTRAPRLNTLYPIASTTQAKSFKVPRLTVCSVCHFLTTLCRGHLSYTQVFSRNWANGKKKKYHYQGHAPTRTPSYIGTNLASWHATPQHWRASLAPLHLKRWTVCSVGVVYRLHVPWFWHMHVFRLAGDFLVDSLPLRSNLSAAPATAIAIETDTGAPPAAPPFNAQGAQRPLAYLSRLTITLRSVCCSHHRRRRNWYARGPDYPQHRDHKLKRQAVPRPRCHCLRPCETNITPPGTAKTFFVTYMRSPQPSPADLATRDPRADAQFLFCVCHDSLYSLHACCD